MASSSQLSGIKDEDLLRKMWQETEDFGRKKEIRAHMYKLREARLREFYVNEMDAKNQTFDAKAPITGRHGVMTDHTSFESLKSSEIHGTDMSDMKFGNAGGWNVITSSEQSDDGKARTEKMMATTEGVTAIKGGQKAFSGKNEELKSERFDGDANNYTFTTGESSNMVLNENIVTGDETSKKTESKSSSVSHTSKVFRSSTNSGDAIDNSQTIHDHDSSFNTTVKSTNNFENTQSSDLSNVKLSQDPARVQEAIRLAQQPGTVLSRSVERTSENQNMITERKELADGTIVTTRRYEPIGQTDVKTASTTSTTSNVNKTTKSSSNIESSVNKTSTRDEEAFRLSQQPGNIISRDISLTDNNTRMITEKKELADGTIVTTKRFEKISSDDNSNKSEVKTSEQKFTSSTNQTFKTARDEEAFRLAQKPGKIISRDISMANPTTRMIVEKKELTDATIVTTKRYESVDSSTSSTINKSTANTDEFVKSLRNDSSTTTTTSSKKNESEQNFRTSRDEEAFRLAQQPGKVISRDVSMANPTTRMIVEKKELTDGTIVTTKRYENVNENVEVKSVRNLNVDTQNVKKTVTNAQNVDTRKMTSNDINTQREAVEETVVKKIFDTSCQCPENMHNHDHKTRDFLKNERTNDQYNIESEIITNEQDYHKTVKKNLDETIRKEEMKKVDQQRKRVDEQEHKISQRLELDSAHKAFASSLRCITPPLEKAPSTRVDRRSPSHETTSSKFSSSTTTIKRNSNVDIRKNDDFMKPTASSDRRSTSKSPEKKVTTTKVTSEVIENFNQTSKSPQKFTDVPRSVSPTKNDLKKPIPSKSTPRETSPTKTNNSRPISPQKQASTPRESSPTKVSQSTPRDHSPLKSSPQKQSTRPQDSSSSKTSSYTPRENSPTKSVPRESSPRKTGPYNPSENSVPHESSPYKSRESSPTKSIPREDSPRKSTPYTPKESSVPHESSPYKSRESSPTKSIPREDSPRKSSPYTPRDNSVPRESSPRKSIPHESKARKSTPYTSRENSVPRESSPTKSISRDSSPIKSSPSTPRESSPSKTINTHPSSPQRQTKSPQKQPRDDKFTITDCEDDEIASATLKIDSIDKTISDLKIIQTIETRDLSATTSVSDLEYISANDHKRMITDLDNEDIALQIDIQNANLLEDLEIKTTISEATKTKKPFNRSETFEERAKKLIGMKSDDEVTTTTTNTTTTTTVKKDVPSYAKPTKASQAPVNVNVTVPRTITMTSTPLITPAPHRVSEIRERKAKIEELENTSTVKKNSITSVTTDFIQHEKCERSPQRSPIQKKPNDVAKKPKDRTSDNEDYKTTKTTTTRVENFDKKTKTNESNRISLSKITDQKTPEGRRSRSPVRMRTPETHITVAQITISPSRGITSKTVTKTTTVESNKALKVAPSIKLVKRIPDVSSTEPDSETDHDLIRNISSKTSKKVVQNRKDSAPVTKTTKVQEKDKVSRSISEKIIKIDKNSKKSVTRESPKRDSKRPTKCIATKTINLTNINDTKTLNSKTLDNVEIDITVQHAKSSREHSPNRIIPIPIHTDEDINDEDTLHPNIVVEPEDERKKKKKIINVPIFQEETKQFVGLEITEVGTEKSQIIIEEDESEESEIDSSTLECADNKRNSVQIDAIDENESGDESVLMSVSQKVNKFNETVEELKKPKTSSNKDHLITLEDASDSGDEEYQSKVTEKVSKFSKKTVVDEKVTKRTENMTRSTEEVDEHLKNDECLLSVSDKVNKFIASAERLSSPVPQRSPELVKNIMKQNVKSKVDTFLTHERSVERDTKKTTSEIALKSTEAIKKAREVFETNSSATKELNRQNDILSRPSVFEAKRSPKVDRKNSNEPMPSAKRSEKSPDRRSPSKTPSPTPRRGSGDRTPIYMKDQVSSKKDLFEKRISSSKIESEMSHQKSLSPQNSIEENRRRSSTDDETVNKVARKISNSEKHYMQHTLASLEHVATTEIREAELHRTAKNEEELRRDSLKSPSKQPSICESYESPRSPTKFGVELKRTDSYKANQSTRKLSATETINIKEIWELSELERLLEIVVGYEQRRRIRAQIRIVKKKIEDKKLSMEIKTSRKPSYSSSPSRSTRTETISKTSTEKPSRVQSVTTTTTTTSSSRYSTSGGEKHQEPKMTTTRTTKITSSSSPKEIIETMNKSNRGKVTENVVMKTTKKATSATSNTQQKKSSSTREPKTETDCITSSYGVGPTDSNGLPLFGLRALRKKGSTSSESKTTGTVISQVSYSENGGPKVTERKTTKYSSDPSDFSHESERNVKGKSIERKSSKGGIYSVTKTEKYEEDSKPSPKVIRNGSVKELKDKFVRKSSSSKVIEKSETKRSSVERESEMKHTRSSSQTKTFLNNEKKASNVQEVITYMRNADNVQLEGDSKEDAEARALLNKFIGATALMTSIESNSGLPKDFLASGGAKNKKASSASKVTKTVTSYSTSAKAHDLNDIWDVDLLKKILESANYDDRRKIRERIRQVMADKEACVDIVKELSAELESTSSVSSASATSIAESSQSVEVKKEEAKEEEEGESLLLPLLKGILQNPKYKHLSARQILSLNLSKAIARQSSIENSVPHSSKMNSEHNNLTDDNRLGHEFPTIEDSGTESGEDLRLLAASLNSMDEVVVDKEENTSEIDGKQQEINNEALGADLLSEVTTALERLQISLNQGKIDLDDSKKIALLSLVNRLQLGLSSPEKKNEIAPEPTPKVDLIEKIETESDIRRGSSGSVNRFSKKKNRANRHTVGVTREELADARRIIEELEMIGMQNTNATNSTPQPLPPIKSIISTPTLNNPIFMRQISEPVTLLRPSQFVPKDPQQEKIKSKLLFKQSFSLDHTSGISKNLPQQEVIPTFLSEKIPTPPIKNNVIQSNGTADNKKFTKKKKNDDEAPTDESTSSGDDDDEMINTKFYSNSAANKFRAKENFLRNQQMGDKVYNYSSGDESHTPGPRQSKYTSKKMKMKRANTVDLPKSFSFVNTFELSDRDCSDNESMTNSRSSGLKTTFMGGNAPVPPKFTPKTENDKKFMAFIQKQNQNAVPTYVNPLASPTPEKTHNWTNKFGNLMNKFAEGGNEPPKPPPKANNAAAKFWMSIEKDKPSAKVSPLPAIPIRNTQPFAKALPTYSEKFPWKNSAEKVIKSEEPAIVKKKLMLDKFEPKEQLPALPPKSIPEPNKLPVLKPSNVNNFSHNPMSAFKPPISRKLSNSFKPIITQEENVRKPMPQISNGLVKQMAETGYNINPPIPQPRKIASSPTRSIANADTTFVKSSNVRAPKLDAAPWTAGQKSERVLSLAASKFENVPTVHLATSLQDPPPTDPIVRFRNNPLYSGTFEKRSSLPPNATYSFESFSKKEIPPKSLTPKDTTFTFTDFTQPATVSTYGKPPSFDRQDSLTNPTKEPLVLTCDRTVISPKEATKPMSIFNATPPFPLSPMVSNDNSIGSICDDLEHELDEIGGSIECQAAISKVMRGPVAQTAYTQSSELTSLNSEAKENSMVKSLHDSLKKLSQKSPTPEKRSSDSSKRLSQDSSNSSIDLKLQTLKLPSEGLSKDSSNSSIDSKLLPPLKIPIPAVPETAYSITYTSPPRIQVKSPSTDPATHVLYNNVSTNLQKVRSIQNLSVPKPATERSITPPGMYGVSQSVIDQKQKTVASFFTPPMPQRTESLKMKAKPFSIAQPQQRITPIPAPRKISLQVKPMTKASSKSHQSMNSLSRSKTMPSLANNVELLDESNIDDAFEELLSSANL